MTLFCLHAFGFLMKMLFAWSLIEALNGKMFPSTAILSVSVLISQVTEWSLL